MYIINKSGQAIKQISYLIVSKLFYQGIELIIFLKITNPKKSYFSRTPKSLKPAVRMPSVKLYMQLLSFKSVILYPLPFRTNTKPALLDSKKKKH